MVGNEGEIEGKEEKSWINLFSKYYGGTKTGVDLSDGDTIVIANIFNLLRSGDYVWGSGDLNVRTWYGLYWSLYASGSFAWRLDFSRAWLDYQYSDYKGVGFSLRKSHAPRKRIERAEKFREIAVEYSFFYMGNYYNFYAATAGSGTSTFTGEAPDSICPKGWRMVGVEGEGSFVKLFAEYYGGTHEDTNWTGTNIDTHLLSSVFSFLRSGDYHSSSGIVDRGFWAGNYWSIKADLHSDARGINFTPRWLYYQGGGSKGFGFSLR